MSENKAFILEDPTVKATATGQHTSLYRPGLSTLIGMVSRIEVRPRVAYVDIIADGQRYETKTYPGTDPEAYAAWCEAPDRRTHVINVQVWGIEQPKPQGYRKKGFTNSRVPKPFTKNEFIVREVEIFETYKRHWVIQHEEATGTDAYGNPLEYDSTAYARGSL
jgi:hypothetical protein